MDLIAYMIHIGSMIVKFVVFIANMLHFEYQTSPQAIHFVFWHTFHLSQFVQILHHYVTKWIIYLATLFCHLL
jgi:hypothetical protein